MPMISNADVTLRLAVAAALGSVVGFETVHLARVSQADMRVGAARLRDHPGVQEVTVKRKATDTTVHQA